jgi:hypothetical protein
MEGNVNEIYFTGNWRNGPELPFPVLSSQMVEDPKGGVILIGGHMGQSTQSRDLYRLEHADEGATWTRLDQQLSVGRERHVALLVPDSLANCTKNIGSTTNAPPQIKFNKDLLYSID